MPRYYDYDPAYDRVYDNERLDIDSLRAQAYIEHIIQEQKIERANLIKQEGYDFEPPKADAPIVIGNHKRRIKYHVHD